MLSLLGDVSRTLLSQNARLGMTRITAIKTLHRPLSTTPWSPSNKPPPTSNDDTFSPTRASVLDAKMAQSDSLWGFIRTEFRGYLEKKGINEHADAEVAWKDREMKFVQYIRPPASPYNGRSVYVGRGDLAGAYGSLTTILRRNTVPYELRMSDRHEKKGVKRRRLSSERWRRRFAHEVRKKVQLVNEIRARGA